MDSRDSPDMLLGQEDSYSEFNRDASSQETLKYFAARPLDHNEYDFLDSIDGKLEHHDIKDDYSDPEGIPAVDVVPTHTDYTSQAQIESGMVEDIVKRADKVCGSRDCYDFRNALVEDKSYLFKEHILSDGLCLSNLRKIKSELYTEEEKGKSKKLCRRSVYLEQVASAQNPQPLDNESPRSSAGPKPGQMRRVAAGTASGVKQFDK